MTEIALPAAMSPWLTVTLDSLQAIARGSATPGTPPVGVPLTVTITLTPIVAQTALLRVGTTGYSAQPYVWKVGPDQTADPTLDQVWPFTDQILDLADPDVITDASQYKVSIQVQGPTGSIVYPGTLTCTGTGGSIDLLSTLSLAATGQTAPVVQGVSVVSASVNPTTGVLTMGMSDGTTLTASGDLRGPAGPTAVSADAGNAATLGTDGKVYVSTASQGGVTDHGLLTGLADDDHTQYHTDVRGDARYPLTTDPRLSDARTPTAHTHPASQISDSTVTGRSVVTAADAAAARTAIGAGTSSFSGAYVDLTGKPTLGTAAAAATTDFATAAQGAKADTALQVATAQPINAQTGTTYTLQASDAGKLLTLTNAAAITLTCPANVFTAGQGVDVIVAGAGMVTCAAGASATVNGTPSLASRAQWSAFTVRYLSATQAVVIGDLA